MKRGWRILLILVTCGIVALLAAVLWPAEREPEYNGKRLSEWLASHKKGGDAFIAVREIGTNAFPYLLRWATYQTPPWKSKLIKVGRRWVPQLSKLFQARFYDQNDERMQNALWGFHVLGSAASPVIPDLVRLVKGSNTNVAITALYLLAGTGDKAVPVLSDVLTNRGAYPTLPPSAVQATATVLRRLAPEVLEKADGAGKQRNPSP